MEESNDTLCVGIDLGTSRSSISASNSERHVIDSYVGWPMDMVARKLVKNRFSSAVTLSTIARCSTYAGRWSAAS